MKHGRREKDGRTVKFHFVKLVPSWKRFSIPRSGLLAKAASETYYDNFYQFVYQLVLSLHSLRTMAKYRWSHPPKKFVSNDELKRIGKFKKTCVLRVSQRTVWPNRSFRDITYTDSVGLFSQRGVLFHDNFAAYWAVMTLTSTGGAIKSRSPYRGIVRTGYSRRIITIFFCLPVQQRLHTRFSCVCNHVTTIPGWTVHYCTLSIRKKRSYLRDFKSRRSCKVKVLSYFYDVV